MISSHVHEVFVDNQIILNDCARFSPSAVLASRSTSCSKSSEMGDVRVWVCAAAVLSIGRGGGVLVHIFQPEDEER